MPWGIFSALCYAELSARIPVPLGVCDQQIGAMGDVVILNLEPLGKLPTFHRKTHSQTFPNAVFFHFRLQKCGGWGAAFLPNQGLASQVRFGVSVCLCGLWWVCGAADWPVSCWNIQPHGSRGMNGAFVESKAGLAETKSSSLWMW